MQRRPPRATRTDTLFPYTTLFRSRCRRLAHAEPGAVDPGGEGIDAEMLHRAEIVQGLHQRQRHAGGDRRPGERQDHPEEAARSEEHTSELQSLMRISYAVFCLKKKKHKQTQYNTRQSPISSH